mmetsp:Transcript_46564/g.92594  ORF Transcript_46564/g.92594 Transcript_46564/m.92594 type:complete len:89 (+) Transcript_46564:1338-1604(+)
MVSTPPPRAVLQSVRMLCRMPLTVSGPNLLLNALRVFEGGSPDALDGVVISVTEVPPSTPLTGAEGAAIHNLRPTRHRSQAGYGCHSC